MASYLHKLVGFWLKVTSLICTPYIYYFYYNSLNRVVRQLLNSFWFQEHQSAYSGGILPWKKEAVFTYFPYLQVFAYFSHV